MMDRGFFFASAEEEKFNIYTRHNVDSTTIKQVVLPHCTKCAKVRQSTSRDHNEARLLSEDGIKHAIAVLSSCTMLNRRRAGLADIEALSSKGKLRLFNAYIF